MYLEGPTQAQLSHPGALGLGLRRRRDEIERSVLERMEALSKSERRDHHDSGGLREVISASIGYGLASIDGGEDPDVQFPSAVREQARAAARAGMALETVLRRFFAGQMLLCDFVIEEARAQALDGASLQKALRNQAILFDLLIGAVTEEYNRELGRRRESIMARRTQTVRSLLEGEPADMRVLAYDLSANHVAAIATGAGAEEGLRELGRRIGRQTLLVRPGGRKVWAWFGGQTELDVSALSKLCAPADAGDVVIALGDPARGLDGWRLSHQQAKAAFSIATRRPSRSARYRDVALLATVANDELLAISLRRRYLDPLATDRDGGKAARETLRSYFAAGRNGSSAAAALGITRRTVANRLRSIEAKLDRSLLDAGAEIEVALSLHELGMPEGPAAGDPNPA